MVDLDILKFSTCWLFSYLKQKSRELGYFFSFTKWPKSYEITYNIVEDWNLCIITIKGLSTCSLKMLRMGIKDLISNVKQHATHYETTLCFVWSMDCNN
jgi:hypothetical protein